MRHEIDNGKRITPTRLVLACLACLALGLPDAVAQDRIEDLERQGYVARWLVCGPFPSDLEGGILDAVKRVERPLGLRDYMGPAGGIERLRPAEGLTVDTGLGQTVSWTRAGADSSMLDLSPFFPERTEGVAFAAFVTRAEQEREVLVELQSVLGARLYLNGVLVSDVRPAPLALAGLDRTLLTLRPGDNVLIVEVPCLPLDALAQALEVPLERMHAEVFANRTELPGSSGYSFALKVSGVRHLQSIMYVPKLTSDGSFIQAETGPAQRASLTLFNPANESSAPFTLRVGSEGALGSKTIEVAAIPGRGLQDVAIPLPPHKLSPGQAILIEIYEGDSVSPFFSAPVTVIPRPGELKVYLVTGRKSFARPPESQREQALRELRNVSRQLQLMQAEPGYGFSLGDSTLWRPYLSLFPESRDTLKDPRTTLAIAASTQLGPVDERIVSGETILRNIAWGMAWTDGILGAHDEVYDVTGNPGLSRQTAQVVDELRLSGIASSVDVSSVPNISLHVSDSEQPAIHRHVKAVRGPATLDELREAVTRQTSALSRLGYTSDVFSPLPVLEHPEPYLIGKTEELATGLPGTALTALGYKRFFEEAGRIHHSGAVRPSLCASSLLSVRAGELIAQPVLKERHSRIENALSAAERFGSLAALMGARFPEDDLDLLWRQLVYASHPERLGFARRPDVYVDMILAQNAMAERIASIEMRALDFLAGQVDTFRQVPVAPGQGEKALVVFNPVAWSRSDLCRARVNLADAKGIRILDEAGAEVPFVAENLDTSSGGIGEVSLSFVAGDVPGMGYRCYYVLPSGPLPRGTQDEALLLENEFLRVTVDPAQGGCITSLIDKGTGEELSGGALGEFVLRGEAPSATQGGRELWATGEQTGAAGGSASVLKKTYPTHQELIVNTEIGAYKLTQTISLWAGLPSVHCALQIEGLGPAPQLASLHFPVAGGASAFAMGDRYGARVGLPGHEGALARSGQAPEGPGMNAEPALRWAALGPGDRLDAGMETTLPLRPAEIVHGEDTSLLASAEALLLALARRHVPSTLFFPDESPAAQGSSKGGGLGDLAERGLPLRILIGGPRQNRESARLFESMDEALRAVYVPLAGAGVALLVDDTASDAPAIPTLCLWADTAEAAGALALDVAEAIEVKGNYSLGLEALRTAHAGPLPKVGLAVLFEGTKLTWTDGAGSLNLGLFHDSAWEMPVEGLEAQALPSSYSFSYALYPFSGSWRNGEVVRAAHQYSEPLRAVLAPIHEGELPPHGGFLEMERPTFVVTALHPVGLHGAALRAGAGEVSEGLLLRGYESSGLGWSGLLRTSLRLRSVDRASPAGRRLAAMRLEGQGALLEVAPNAIESFLVRTQTAPLRADAPRLDAQLEGDDMRFSKYWLHNEGAAPLGAARFSAVLRGAVGGDTPPVLVLSNLDADYALSGEVTLLGPEGWHLSPERFSFTLEPLSHATRELLVIPSGGDTRQAGLMVKAEVNGVTYYDVLHDEAPVATLRAEREGGEVVAYVTNLSAIPLEGSLTAVRHPAPRDPFGAVPASGISPTSTRVSLPPFGEQRILLRLTAPGPLDWIALKLAVNGQVFYRELRE